MLRACAIQYGTGWDKCTPYAEFSYNNGYQAGLRRSHRLRHRMAKVRDTAILEPNGREAGVRTRPYRGCFEQVDQDELLGPDEKSYADVRREDLTFKVDDFVYLKWKEKAKWLISWSCHQTYRHTQCVPCVPTKEVFEGAEEQAPPEGLDVREDLTYTEHPVKILETSERVT
ncbi:hypothetical protein U9M48_027795 [Paspalum notatum var. saurae]|uniref:Uncharacterized protein n=1 Tax=Paspalum notatum var. saurae TaxID=547442 RepID=A0AAQ3X0H2_PASNO